MISPHRIKFNKIASNELNVFDLIMCVAFESDNGDMNTFLSRESVSSESYDGRYKRVARYKYNESFSPKFTFMKKDFGNFTIDETRQVLKWLTSIDTTSVLDVYYDDSEVVSWSAIGGWTEINTHKFANNRTVGVTATFESVTPYAFSDIHTVTKTISSATDNKITINIDTDDNQPIYPRITINEKGIVVPIPEGTVFNTYSDMVSNTVYYNGTRYFWKAEDSHLTASSEKPNYDWPQVIRDAVYMDSDEIREETIYYYTLEQEYRWIDPYVFRSSTSNPGFSTTSVRIINKHYDMFDNLIGASIMAVKNNNSTETIIVDGANQVISSSSTRRIFGDDFVNWQWLPLYDGKNELTIEGNCEIQLAYREVRKPGEY
jgi:hypothetical protein